MSDIVGKCPLCGRGVSTPPMGICEESGEKTYEPCGKCRRALGPPYPRTIREYLIAKGEMESDFS